MLPQAITGLVQKALGGCGLHVVKQSTLQRLYRSEESEKSLKHAIAFLRSVPSERAARFLQLLEKSRSQLLQDLFVLDETGFKRDGFFVEFGAANGIDLSNTYLLETEFGWRGILAEPARRWRSALQANRRAALEFDCVWSASGESITFNETEVGEFSTIEQFSFSDVHRHQRGSGQRYDVRTISLSDLLARHGAPRHIDYLSIDTEGSEYDILEAFDFGTHHIDIITVEHNFTANRDRIHDLLTGHGYARVRETLSDFDDWYVHRDTPR